MAPQLADQTIDHVRAASRTLVRKLGFMGGRFAGTDLSPSVVHALIEMGAGVIAARDLAERLHLDKSSVSRMVKSMIGAGFVVEAAARDGRVKILQLSDRGQEKLAEIELFARHQVADALKNLVPDEVETVSRGLDLYAGAVAPRAEKIHPPAVPQFTIRRGFQTGLIARVTHMHALYYAEHADFGQSFEQLIAAELSAFCSRLSTSQSAIWSAMMGAEILGSIAIEGGDLASACRPKGVTGFGKKTRTKQGHRALSRLHKSATSSSKAEAHLRWFIVDPKLRGAGAGRQLLSAALDFVDAEGFAQTRLRTFSSLTAARSLYEANGFVLVDEMPGSCRWGKAVVEQEFVRLMP